MHTSRMVRGGALGVALGGLAMMGACEGNGTAPLAAVGGTKSNGDHLVFENRSVTPALVKDLMPGVEAFTLLSSDDTLPKTPGYVFGGSADGAGLLRNADGTYTLLVNNEDNWAVSRITLDKHFRPTAGEYLVNSTNGTSRLCSATLATAAQGFAHPTFITAGESSVESMIRAVDPFGAPNTSQPLPAFGRWSAEQALPLPTAAFPGKTVVVIGDDDSGPFGGQLALYVANAEGDLSSGSLYVLARPNDDTRETAMVAGQQYPVVFRQIVDPASLTGAQINAAAAALNAVRFGRVEDVDYRHKAGAEREVYFNVTGQNTTGANADHSRTKYGRTYQLVLDPADPTKGTLEVLLDGDDRSGPAGAFQDPDNIVATANFLYIEEDPNGYGDETHDARIYQYDLASKQLRTVLELDHRRDRPDAAKYNVGGLSKFGDWESSGLLDISEQTGEPGTFLVGIQAHTWTGARYRNADGGTLRPTEEQASQLLVLRGLPR